MSENWSEGYFTDTTYISEYYRELSPTMIRFCMLLQKIMPPTAEDISYCELGYGQGLSLNIHAATVPGTFAGTDFNPTQTAGARRLCAASGSPLTLYNDSFEEFSHRELPQFNYIVMHGIWSWVNSHNRNLIVDFVRTHLKVGGAFYISYNCNPGWAAAAPLRHVFALHDKYIAHTNSIPSRTQQAISFTEQLFEAQPNYIKSATGLTERLHKMKTMNPSYLCHEYFNETWDLMYFTDVVNLLEPAKVNYAASANPIDNISGLCMSPEAQTFLTQIENPILREQLRDYFTNAQFRKDIFVCGGIPLSAIEQRDLLLQQRFVLIAHQQPEKFEVPGGMGKLTLKPEMYAPVISALKENDYAPRTLQSLAQQLAGQDIKVEQVLSTLILLMGAGQVSPCQSQEAEKRCKATAQSCNAALCRKAHTSGESASLASPVTGGGVAVNRIEQLLLEAWMKGGDAPRMVWEIMKGNNEKMAKNGVAIEQDEDNIKAITEAYVAFETRLPLLKALGIAV